MELRDALFAALRYELTGTLPENVSFDAIDEPFLTALYEYSNRQEVAHLVGDALERLGVLSKFSDAAVEPFRRRQAVAAYHAEQQRQVFEEISTAFDAEKIPYLPLKGLVIRPLYPEPWMRTAGDLDILVKQEDLERAETVLTGIGAKKIKEGSHDISYLLPPRVMIELHYRLLEDERANGAKEALDEIWEHSKLVEEGRFEYRMEDAWFYYYHLVHAAKHFEEGTCGIRPFLDLWILNHKTKQDPKQREKLLEEQGLLAFSRAAEALSETWISGAEPDEWTKSFETFLLAGGTFGNDAVRWSAGVSGKGGKLRYFFSRAFPSYWEMKLYYPALCRHKWLLPFFWVVRWFRLLFCGGILHNRQTRNQAKEIGGERTRAELRKHLGL